MIAVSGIGYTIKKALEKYRAIDFDLHFCITF